MGSQSTKKKIELKKKLTIILSAILLLTPVFFEFAYRSGISDWSLSAELLEAFNAGNADSKSQVVEFLNVGQGDCTIIKSGDMTAVIDFGTDGDDEIYKRLLKLGAEQVDLAVITHHHSDHMGGFIKLISKMKVSRLLINDTSAADADKALYKRVKSVASRSNVKVYNPKEGSIFKIGKATLKVLYTSDLAQEENNRSIVIMVHVGGKNILVTGDSETEVERYLCQNCDVDCDILKLGHHGSYTASSEKFLKATTPLVAVASAGYDNMYGHSSKWTLLRLEAAKVKLYRTDLDKTVSITFDEKNKTFSVTTERRAQW